MGTALFEKKATFIEHNDWLRDHYLCSTCNSIPRQRALIHALHTFFQNGIPIVSTNPLLEELQLSYY